MAQHADMAVDIPPFCSCRGKTRPPANHPHRDHRNCRIVDPRTLSMIQTCSLGPHTYTNTTIICPPPPYTFAEPTLISPPPPTQPLPTHRALVQGAPVACPTAGRSSALGTHGNRCRSGSSSRTSQFQPAFKMFRASHTLTHTHTQDVSERHCVGSMIWGVTHPHSFRAVHCSACIPGGGPQQQKSRNLVGHTGEVSQEHNRCGQMGWCQSEGTFPKAKE